MRKFYGVGEDVPFQVYITPLDNEKTTGEWVSFPTTPEAMKELFLRLDIGPSDWNIVNVECNVYGIPFRIIYAKPALILSMEIALGMIPRQNWR